MIAVASPAAAAGGELVWGLTAAAAAYFAPTLLALARHRGAAPLTFSFNLLLGWTGVGWVLAWFLALADRRLHIYVTSPGTMLALVPAEQPPSITLAPDGRHWWDGYVWRDGWQIAPRGALWSPDSAHWFTGAQWVATIAAPVDLAPSAGGEPDLQIQPEWWRRTFSRGED
jgi:Superinfection immunity protein